MMDVMVEMPRTPMNGFTTIILPMRLAHHIKPLGMIMELDVLLKSNAKTACLIVVAGLNKELKFMVLRNMDLSREKLT